MDPRLVVAGALAALVASCGGGGGEPDTGGDGDAVLDDGTGVPGDTSAEADPEGEADAAPEADGDRDGDEEGEGGEDGDGEDGDGGDGGDGDGRLFSFAILTDIHIGEGPEDYGDPGHDDSGGDEYELTTTARVAVAKVNMGIEEYDTAFAMALGDLSDSGERSELAKCKQVLDQLEVPYFPLIGNHDVWPYTASTEADAPVGDEYFETVFAPQFEILAAAFEGFEKAPTPVWNPERRVTSRFVNFAFDFAGYHFVALDLVTREHAPFGYPGVGASADLHDFEGGTWRWLTTHLDGYSGLGERNVFLFCHHPPIVTSLGIDSLAPGEYVTMDDFIRSGGYGDAIFGFFSGHHHLAYDLVEFDGQHVVVTPATKDGAPVRIVQVFADGRVDYSVLL